MENILKILLLILFVPVLVFAQGEFVDTSHVGIIARYGLVSNSIVSGGGGTIGISPGGTFDLAADFVNSKIKNEQYRKEFKSSSVLIYLAYNIKRTNSSSNLKIMGGLLVASQEKDGSKNEQISGLALGLSFSVRAINSPDFSLIPALNLTYGFLSVESYDYMLDTRSLSLDLNLKFKMADNVCFIFTPSVSKDLVSTKNSVLYSLLGGLLFDIEI